jgi:hypothetical protein
VSMRQLLHLHCQVCSLNRVQPAIQQLLWSPATFMFRCFDGAEVQCDGFMMETASSYWTSINGDQATAIEFVSLFQASPVTWFFLVVLVC